MTLIEKMEKRVYIKQITHVQINILYATIYSATVLAAKTADDVGEELN
jgi:hypothetical protein